MDHTEQWLVGLATFVAVPALLWITGSLISRTKHGWEALFAYVTGAKNRLSLSRAQAFAWTLVIFGSFAAAMAIHRDVKVGTPEQMKKAAEAETAYESVTDQLQLDLIKKRAIAAQAESAAGGRDAPQVKEAEEAVRQAQAALDQAMAIKLSINPYNWVTIPATLLALAGIAISSGVFSTVISVVSGESKESELDAIEFSEVVPPPPPGTPLLAGQIAATDKLAPCAGQQVMTIKGKHFGEKGKVRLINAWRSEVAFDAALDWQDTQIIIRVPPPQRGAWKTLIIDTPNGKLCYELRDGMQLGREKAYYELADLFREDKDPTKYDLMKFQMFGWTVIAIAIYIWLFLQALSPTLASLPVVPESIVLLTGLSQAGYLGGKAVTNMGK